MQKQENIENLLLSLNEEGFIPGPFEGEDSFFQRVEMSKALFSDPDAFRKQWNLNDFIDRKKRVKKPRWNWSQSSLFQHWDFYPEAFSAFYDNKDLHFFEGGAMWILEVAGVFVPIIKVKKSLKKRRLLFLYPLEEILSHEAIHAARIAFEEPKFEEFFAYYSSESRFRRFFGPLVESTKEIFVFFILLLFTLVFQILSLFSLPFFSYLFALLGVLSIGYLGLGLLRLGKKRWFFSLAFRKLFHLLKEEKKAKAVLFRLRDKEINLFAKLSLKRVVRFIQRKKSSPRWRMIKKAYFSKLESG